MLRFLIARARQILKDEGFSALLSRTLLYFKQRLFTFRRFYLYEHTLRERNEADYIPGIPDFTLKIVSSNSQADEIASQGFEDLRERPVIINARLCLDKGAIAFCFYVGKELAHTGFVAISKEAKNTFDILPYEVDFAHGQACTGGTVTLPKYRNKGFMTYSYFKRLEFLRQKGYTTSRNAVEAGNKASQKVHAKFGPRVFARARILRIAGCPFWKETPFASGDDKLS